MPDNILARTFDELGLAYQQDLYFRNRSHALEFEKPSREKPLIYKLLGNIEEPESLVLTHSDFFDYMKSVFLAKSMHPQLRDELEKAERYIFLGLPYEKWYFQLLLRVLSLQSDRLKDIERMALAEFENLNLRRLYTEEFKINFLPTQPEVFIQNLYKACERAGILKELPVPDPALAHLPDLSINEVKELVAKAEMDRALFHVQASIDRLKPRSNKLMNDLIVLRNQYNLLRQREQRGTIDSRDLTVEYSQIVDRLLVLVDQVVKLK